MLSYVYPRPVEGLLKFLEIFQKNNSQVGLCPRCDVVYDANAAKRVRFYPRRGKGHKFVVEGENSGC